jgi:hypothetical protein
MVLDPDKFSNGGSEDQNSENYDKKSVRKAKTKPHSKAKQSVDSKLFI